MFPYLEVSGSYKEVGLAIGETFRGKIQEVIEDRKHYIRRYQEKLLLIEPYVRAAQKYFPHLVEEMEGMADGALVPFRDLFFHNTPEIYDHTMEWDREQAQTEDHCTIAVSFGKKEPLIGHNEDWMTESLDELYILKATIGETTFLGLNYATFLSGCSASINNWGLVQCINELHETPGNGVGKYFISRAILECRTLDEAEACIRKSKRASGYNHVLFQGSEMRDIEVSGNDMDVLIREKQPYAHTNHYLSLHMQKYERDEAAHHINSYERLKRVMELLHNNMTFADMTALLSDTKNPLYPVCREHTIASVIIEPNDRQIHVCFGPPNKGTFIRYTL